MKVDTLTVNYHQNHIGISTVIQRESTRNKCDLINSTGYVHSLNDITNLNHPLENMGTIVEIPSHTNNQANSTMKETWITTKNQVGKRFAPPKWLKRRVHLSESGRHSL